MKASEFTNKEIETLKGIIDSYISYISYMLASGVYEDYCEIRAWKNLIKENKI